MILQFGKIPPPIGGISIHVKRLLFELEQTSIKTELFDYSKERNVFSIVNKIWRNDVVHIHLSRKRHRLLFIIIFRSLFKKVIVTFHGKFDFKNKYDFLSLKFAHISVVLNEISFANAQKFRNNSVYLIGAFIPPLNKVNDTLTPETNTIIKNLKSKYENVYCTNAWNIVFDTEQREIYNGSLLLELFEKLKANALVFSDPVGNYSRYLKNKYGYIPENIHFITYQHDFIDVIKLTDAFIRPTTTDGDSLSVHEALFYKKDVIASNVVDRPNGCILYKEEEDLKKIISNFNQYKDCYKNYSYRDNIIELKKLYLEISD